jgi:NACHT domain
VYGKQHIECLEGTRLNTLNDIRGWANEEGSSRWIYCLLDVAGSGKSTVAKHMVEEWEREERLVARFFFSRDTEETMGTDLFCSTVGDALARNKKFAIKMDEFKERRDYKLLSFKQQFEGLVSGPLEAMDQYAILTIDALDECDNKYGGRTMLLETLCCYLSSTTPRLRIFVTGRPERDIKEWAETHVAYTNFNRLEGDSEDVKLYITKRLPKLATSIQGRISDVIRKAEGLFIWARLACDLLEQALNPESLLKTLEEEMSLDLDYLYMIALEQSMPKDKTSREAIILVLQMIMAARSPLSIADMEQLVPTPKVIEPVVTCLSSLLVYQDRNDPIRLLHITFREFITNRLRARTYFVQLQFGHYTLASGCLNILSNYLKQHGFNPKQLEGHSDNSHSVYQARVWDYSSDSWAYHCSGSCRKLALNGQLLDFMQFNFGFWMNILWNKKFSEFSSHMDDIFPMLECNMVSSRHRLDSYSFTYCQTPEITKTIALQSLTKVCSCIL